MDVETGENHACEHVGRHPCIDSQNTCVSHVFHQSDSLTPTHIITLEVAEPPTHPLTPPTHPFRLISEVPIVLGDIPSSKTARNRLARLPSFGAPENTSGESTGSFVGAESVQCQKF